MAVNNVWKSNPHVTNAVLSSWVCKEPETIAFAKENCIIYLNGLITLEPKDGSSNVNTIDYFTADHFNRNI